MKIALITDTHFGVRNDSQIFQRYFDKFLENVFFPELQERNIDTLIHLGDLVDRRKYINYVTLNSVRRNFIFKLGDMGIDTHIIVGNHDTYYKNTNEVNAINELFSTYDGKSEPWVYHNPTTKNFDGLDICLMPWICGQNYNECMQELETTNAQILMGHLEVNGYTMFPGSVCVHGFDREIFSKFDKVYSGHFHYKNGDSTITYLGTPWELMWSDYGDRKGFYIFDRFLDRLYKLNPADVNIIEDSYSILDETGDFNFEAEDTLTTLIKYVDDIETDLPKNKLKDLMKVLYTEAHDYL